MVLQFPTMSNLIDDKTTSEVANLIKINISDSDLPKYTKQLNAVLDAIEVFKEIDTSGVETTSQTHGLTNVLREDETEKGLDIDKYPNRQNLKNGYFEVRKVL